MELKSGSSWLSQEVDFFRRKKRNDSFGWCFGLVVFLLKFLVYLTGIFSDHPNKNEAVNFRNEEFMTSNFNSLVTSCLWFYVSIVRLIALRRKRTENDSGNRFLHFSAQRIPCMVYLRPKRMICPRPFGMTSRKAKKRGRREEFG